MMKFSGLCPKKKKNKSQQSSYVLLIRSQSYYLIVNMQMNQLKNMVMICDLAKHTHKRNMNIEKKTTHGDVTEPTNKTHTIKNETKHNKEMR